MAGPVEAVFGMHNMPGLELGKLHFRDGAMHGSAVVTVGAFISGNAGNVIAQSAILRLSIRTTTPEDRATDRTPPTVFLPQRHPWNPGSVNFGPLYRYQQHASDDVQCVGLGTP